MKLIQHVWSTANQVSLGETKVDLAFADPPYNQGVKYDEDPTHDTMPVPKYRELMCSVMTQLASNIRQGGTLWWLCPSSDGDWVWSHLLTLGRLLYKRPIIWHERFAQYQHAALTADYRLLFPVLIGNVDPVFNPDAIREESVRQRMKDKRADPRGRVPGHVWETRRLQGTSVDRVDWHKAQLPPETLDRIILGWTNRGDIVLDAFAGSGALAVRCRQHQRRYIGFERSPFYISKIEERMSGD